MNSRVTVIAEAGVNHNGDLDKALSLIEVAAKSGADYVKFQTFIPNKIASPKAKKAKYQIDENENEDQLQMLRKLEIKKSWYPKLINHSYDNNIKFLSTAFDLDSLKFLRKLGLQIFKIPSGEITNKPYLQEVGSYNKKIILSTGMSDINDIKLALDVIIESGTQKKNITVLHCNTEYPTPYEDVNLNAMNHISTEFNVDIGYSDHTMGIEVAIAAVAIGAKVIEKHFTLDKNLSGPDHSASLEPNELFQMVKSIRRVEKSILGNGIKSPSISEKMNVVNVRKSLHYSSILKKGHTIDFNDLISLRPGDGVSPMSIQKIIGLRLKLDVKENQKLDLNHFE